MNIYIYIHYSTFPALSLCSYSHVEVTLSFSLINCGGIFMCDTKCKDYTVHSAVITVL